MHDEYTTQIHRWLDGHLRQVSRGMDDVKSQGGADIHHSQLTGRRILEKINWVEVLDVFRAMMECLRDKGDYVVMLRVMLGFRRSFLAESLDATRLLAKAPPRQDPVYYVLSPLMAAIPYPPELHRVPAKWVEFSRQCPMGMLFYEAFRHEQDIVQGEDYATNLIGIWPTWYNPEKL